MISIIVAKSQNNVIGKGNDLPWYLPADLKHFKKTTTGHKVIMGRKTYESIFDRLKKTLPNRTNIIITRDKTYKAENCIIVNSLEEAIEKTNKDENAFIIGGANIYEQSIKDTDKLYITEVHTEIKGDKFFPALDSSWKEIKRIKNKADEKNEFNYDFVEYTRK